MKQTACGVGAILITALACSDSRPTGLRAGMRPNAEAVAAQSGRQCHAVEGTIVERITGPNTAAGKVTGDLAGDVSIVITSMQQLEGGLVKFEAQCTMVTPQGTLTTTDHANLSPIDAPLYRVNNHLFVSGGTGMYEHASGNLHTHGTVNFRPDGLVDLHYRGELCDDQK